MLSTANPIPLVPPITTILCSISMNKTPLRFPLGYFLFKERYFLEKIIIPITVFVVTTADPPEKIELVQQDIFEHLWEDVFP